MKLFDKLLGRSGSSAQTIEEQDALNVKGQEVKVIEIGSSGTELFAGDLQEDYLQDLQGTKAADAFDKMRRSDPKVKMAVSAMKNPISAANWEIQTTDDTVAAEQQKNLIEHIIFNDMGKTWDRFLREALSMVEFGYSLFEITYKAEINHPTFGAYNGIKSVAFRSQRTIERWDIERSGKLGSVEQQAFGDHQKVVSIPAEYLLHFAIEMEGDNFEGISILRPAYGPWLRKNKFLQLLAAGMEKYAIPIPALKVPAGKENTKEYKLAKQALLAYVSNRCNFLMYPEGYELELTATTFDADKIRSVIDAENIEIVNAALANFLELGQSGSGSYSLGTDLSDFFLGGLEYVADQITETINTELIPKLVALNFSDGIVRCKLAHSGIRDKAGKELAEVISILSGSGVLRPDEKLEESLRKRFGLPEKEETTERTEEVEGEVVATDDPSEDGSIKESSLNGAQVAAIVQVVTSFKQGVLDKQSATELLVTAFPIPRNIVERIVGEEISVEEIKAIGETQLAEVKKKPRKKELGVDDMIDKGADNLGVLYVDNLDKIQEEMIARTVKFFDSATEAQKFKLTKDDLLKVPGIATYRKQVKEELDRTYDASMTKVKKEQPGLESKKLAELPKAKRRIASDTTNTVDVQVDDLAKAIVLQYGMSVESTNDSKVIAQDIREASDKTKKRAASTGATIASAKVVNDARRDFFGVFSEEIISYTWVNTSPVSAICEYLSGRTVPAEHPDVQKYWPPLHHNCKTWVVANTEKTKDNPEPQSSFAPSKTATDSITLGEKCC